jgi:hypothetical protein
MPSGKNWVNFIYINLAFVLYITGTFFLSSVQDIKANWSVYRCNPIYMPLSDNIEQDFMYCVQNIQTSYMGYLLQPLTFITSSITDTLGTFVEDINSVRAMFDKIRTFFSSIVQSVFGVFLNLVIEFQKITIGIKDLLGKTIGIMVTLMYMMDGSIKTMNSTWNGPPGQLVKALGKCFHPSTQLVLQSGEKKEMKNIELGDVLEDGSFVEATMKIDNTKDPVPLYRIITEERKGEKGEKGKNEKNVEILVTGSHLVYDKEKYTFIKVENYFKAIKTTIQTDSFCCLITNTHKIPIAGEVFWDWEDHFVKK